MNRLEERLRKARIRDPPHVRDYGGLHGFSPGTGSGRDRSARSHATNFITRTRRNYSPEPEPTQLPYEIEEPRLMTGKRRSITRDSTDVGEPDIVTFVDERIRVLISRM